MAVRGGSAALASVLAFLTLGMTAAGGGFGETLTEGQAPPGTTFYFAPADDAFVDASRPKQNFGASRTMRTGRRPLQRSYLRFDVEGLTGTPTKARLEIFAKTGSVTGYFVHRSAAFEETRITYRNAPPPGARVESSGPFAARTWTEVDVTSAMEWSGSVTFALVGRSPTTTSYGTKESVSRDPRLVIETTQDPSPSPSPSPSTSPDAPLVVAAAGDIACDPANRDFQNGEGTATNCRQKATSELVLALRPHAVLVLGDVQYEDGALSKYAQSYDPTWGRFKDITFPAQGNHDGAVPGFFEYFDRVPRVGYYSFDLGEWHFVALNSMCEWVRGCHVGSQQEQWLRADLAAHPAACTIAYLHHPRFSSGPHGDNPALAPLWNALYEGGVDLLLAGHDHLYERFRPLSPDGSVDLDGGIRQFIVGTGGRFIHPIGAQREHSERLIGSFGVLRLNLYSTSYEWAFVSPSAGPEQPLDEGNDDCH